MTIRPAFDPSGRSTTTTVIQDGAREGIMKEIGWTVEMMIVVSRGELRDLQTQTGIEWKTGMEVEG